MEIYSNGTDAQRTVVLSVPVTPNTGTMQVTAVRDGETIHNFNTVTAVSGGFSVVVPFSLTQTGADLTLNWEFSYSEDGYPFTFSESTGIEIVTPILTSKEILEIYPSATPEEVDGIEKAVRHIIQAHTGQSFGFSKDKTIVVEGHGERALRLPERLITLKRLTTMNAVLDPNSAIVTSDGWFLKKGWSAETEVILSDNTYFGGSDVSNVPVGAPGYEKPGHGHIIYSPRANVAPTPWRDDYPFAITGDWGYKSVPAPVKEAAKLLTNDYACSEQLYRDRYLESIKAADWRLQFNSRAWENTGNVRADQLLAEYVLLPWAVV